MANEGLIDDLNSLIVVAEDIRDGRRTEPFTPEEAYRLCNELRRAVERLSMQED